MTTKLTRRQFLATAATATAGALVAGIVTLAPARSAGEAEAPVEVEDIQAVPLGLAPTDSVFVDCNSYPDCSDCPAWEQCLTDPSVANPEPALEYWTWTYKDGMPEFWGTPVCAHEPVTITLTFDDA